MIHDGLVTCPESAHLEQIRYITEPDGRIVLLLRCSRFVPAEGVDCDWVCVNRLNCRLERARRK